MTKAIVAATALLALAGCGSQGPAGDSEANVVTARRPSAPVRPSDAEIDRLIRQGAAEWANVAVTGDTTPLKRIIADDYVGVSSWGEVRDKAKLLAPSASRDFSASKVDYVNIRHFGDTAVAQGAETLTRKDGGAPLRLIWTDVWQFRAGRWQIVASQDSVRPPL